MTAHASTTEALGLATQALREDRMIYQRSAKEDAARRLGLPDRAFYHLPYAEWATVRDGLR